MVLSVVSTWKLLSTAAAEEELSVVALEIPGIIDEELSCTMLESPISIDEELIGTPLDNELTLEEELPASLNDELEF
jgi:hypothetical protein